MSIEKLTIKYENGRRDSFTGSLEVGFNPKQLEFSADASWDHVEPTLGSKSTNQGTTIFRSTTPNTLSLNLFFDTYAPYPAPISLSLFSTSPTSVATQTSAVMRLGRVDTEMHRPPVCRLVWGKTTLFSGVLQKSSCTYTMFWSDGTPVRATMQCTFLELADASASSELHSADVAKRYVVKPGDTLMGIAAVLLGNGASWRLIADENALENPRVLVPGQTLSIPKVR